MTKTEIIKIYGIITGSYPNHFKNVDESTVHITLEMWHSAFKDVDFYTLFKVLQKYILENPFPPTIADLRREVVQATNPSVLTSPEMAWEQVIIAIKKYGYYQQDKAFETFSEPIKRAVKAIGWQNICTSENIGIERSNFYKMYDALNVTEREQYILPTNLFEAITKLDKTKYLEAAAENHKLRGVNNDESLS